MQSEGCLNSTGHGFQRGEGYGPYGITLTIRTTMKIYCGVVIDEMAVASSKVASWRCSLTHCERIARFAKPLKEWLLR